MKIAILVNKETMETCTGKGCLNAYLKKIDSFDIYEEADLIGFTNSQGDIDRKIEKFKENQVETIHLASCLRSQSDTYYELAEKLSKDFNVIGYTHGSKEGKNRETVFLRKKV